MLSHKFAPVMQNLLEETNCSFDRPPSRLLLRIAYISQGWITAPLGRAGFGGLHPRTFHCFPRFSTEGQYSLYRDGTGCEQNLWQPHLNRIYTY